MKSLKSAVNYLKREKEREKSKNKDKMKQLLDEQRKIQVSYQTEKKYCTKKNLWDRFILRFFDARYK